MKIKHFVTRTRIFTRPYASIAEIEERLLRDGHLVVLDEDGNYVGLITPEAVLKKRHNLVIDCLAESAGIEDYKEVRDALNRMLEERVHVLPVFSNERVFLGTVSLSGLLQELHNIENGETGVIFQNIIGPTEIEDAKSLFIKQMFHNVKNPLQAVLSSVQILAETKNPQDKGVLMKCIESNIHKVDTLLETLYAQYHDMHTL